MRKSAAKIEYVGNYVCCALRTHIIRKNGNWQSRLVRSGEGSRHQQGHIKDVSSSSLTISHYNYATSRVVLLPRSFVMHSRACQQCTGTPVHVSSALTMNSDNFAMYHAGVCSVNITFCICHNYNLGSVISRMRFIPRTGRIWLACDTITVSVWVHKFAII